MTIGLIGAGAAGAACVSVLRSRGADFLVFEKSRGAGGRLTTRRINGIENMSELSFDHGCPRFEWSQSLQQRVSANIQAKTIQKFGDYYVASPSMPQLVKDLLGSVKIKTQTEIESIEGGAGAWYLKTKPASEATMPPERFGPFESLVITAPAPQAIKLLSGVSCAWEDELKKIAYAPCWSLMFTVRSEHVSSNLKDDPLFESLLPQNSKPGRTETTGLLSWVAQASADWSLAHLENSAEDVVKQLLPHALRLTGHAPDSVVYSVAHRWRYSRVVSSLSTLCLADDAQGLYYAGDGCLGQGVAGAIQSGLAVGERLTDSVG